MAIPGRQQIFLFGSVWHVVYTHLPQAREIRITDPQMLCFDQPWHIQVQACLPAPILLISFPCRLAPISLASLKVPVVCSVTHTQFPLRKEAECLSPGAYSLPGLAHIKHDFQKGYLHHIWSFESLTRLALHST